MEYIMIKDFPYDFTGFEAYMIYKTGCIFTKDPREMSFMFQRFEQWCALNPNEINYYDYVVPLWEFLAKERDKKINDILDGDI